MDVKQHSNNFNHQNDSCIKEGSDESHFNDSLIVRDKTVSANHNLFEEKGSFMIE